MRRYGAGISGGFCGRINALSAFPSPLRVRVRGEACRHALPALRLTESRPRHLEPFERSSHGLSRSNQSTGLICLRTLQSPSPKLRYGPAGPSYATLSP